MLAIVDTGPLVAAFNRGDPLHQLAADLLRRPDILAVGDLGVRRAAQIAYELDELPTPARLTEIAEPWRPYRTTGCLILWWSLDNAPA